MTNAEVIAELRGHIREVPLTLLRDAADALEAADKRIDGLQKLVDLNTERCEALRKQLRESHESYEQRIAEQQEQIAKLYTLLNNRINEIAELEAQIPKEGEWISSYDGFEYDVRCSVCGEEALIKEGGSHDHAYSHYCPSCGSVMKGEQE